MANTNPRQLARHKRRARVRKKIRGTAERPRLSVFRSAKHIYAQVIDDHGGRTLLSVSTLTPEIRGDIKGGGNKDAATQVGKMVAAKAKDQGLKVVVFDRNGFLYHGRVKALADAAREGGLEF